MSANLHLPKVGELAPNFVLPTIDGRMLELEHAPKAVVLVFLRHLA